MFGLKIGRLACIGVSIASLAVLAGCGTATTVTKEEQTARNQLRPEIKVEHTVHRHMIPVDPARIDFEEQERRDLYDFLVGVGARPGDTVVVAARRARLEQRGEIVRFVRQVGLKPDLRLIKEPKQGAEDDGYDSAVLVRVDRYVTHDITCGRWKDSYSDRFNNFRPPNFGCSDTAALQRQVAYPSSLIAGETLDFPEGDVAAEAVRRYRGRAVEGIVAESAAGSN